MQCHKGAVRSIDIDQGGYHMATSGMDAQLRIWDIRNYKPVHEYFTPRPADAMDISQRGLLGLVAGKDVQIWL